MRNPATGRSLIERAADIVVAYVSNNPVDATHLTGLIGSVHETLRTASGALLNRAGREPAIDVDKSACQDYIVCLEDGQRFKSLRRHLRVTYNLAPEEYRAKWALPENYPLVAPGYAARRSQIAREIGLGRTYGRSRKNQDLT